MTNLMDLTDKEAKLMLDLSDFIGEQSDIHGYTFDEVARVYEASVGIVLAARDAKVAEQAKLN